MNNIVTVPNGNKALVVIHAEVSDPNNPGGFSCSGGESGYLRYVNVGTPQNPKWCVFQPEESQYNSEYWYWAPKGTKIKPCK